MWWLTEYENYTTHKNYENGFQSDKLSVARAHALTRLYSLCTHIHNSKLHFNQGLHFTSHTAHALVAIYDLFKLMCRIITGKKWHKFGFLPWSGATIGHSIVRFARICCSLSVSFGPEQIAIMNYWRSSSLLRSMYRQKHCCSRVRNVMCTVQCAQPKSEWNIDNGYMVELRMGFWSAFIY